MKIALAQINPVIADIEGNLEKIASGIDISRKNGADLVVFPEMTTMGYPPMDLLENRKLIDDNLRAIDTISKYCSEIAVICGYVDYDNANPPMLLNSAALLTGKKIVFSQAKTLLPTYDVFDELRYFSSAETNEIAEINGLRIGITICEDIWAKTDSGARFMERRRYGNDPVSSIAGKGVDLLVNISASPFIRGKNSVRRAMLADLAKCLGCPVVYVNQVGGNDSLVFDGNSMVFNSNGDLIGRARAFEEDIVIVDTLSGSASADGSDIEDIRQALVLGVRDYVKKSGFKKAVLGLSGGIDSALTAAIAVTALGKENVTGITMPSVYSSEGSIIDSRELARNLGIRFMEVPIQPIYEKYLSELGPILGSAPVGRAEENIQARIRGNILMALSNKEGGIVLSTGNKSELAMGYCTLYGDMSGGLAVISDLPKTLVYELARHINLDREIIPLSSITKEPSAELRENQKDTDSLPPYEIVDPILELYIEDRLSTEEIISKGFDRNTVHKILNAVNMNEYKRQQAAPGIKITSKAFGIGRRTPIAKKYRP